jgi:hypothetical protein
MILFKGLAGENELSGRNNSSLLHNTAQCIANLDTCTDIITTMAIALKECLEMECATAEANTN